MAISRSPVGVGSYLAGFEGSKGSRIQVVFTLSFEFLEPLNPRILEP